MAWTKAQQAAIDQRGANILVSAAAGSGKTAVLTERVVNRIIGSQEEKPIEIDRFLIVTFTSAAANEMKERIASKLSDKITLLQEIEAEGDTHAIEKITYLERQVALLQTASISTIHSFCLKVIKAYFNHLEIDPNIKVGNQAELSIIKRDILEEIIEEKFGEEDESFLKLAEVYGSVQDLSPLINLILDVHTFSKSTPFPEQWLDEKVELLLNHYKDIGDTPWTEALRGSILSQIQDIVIIYKEAISLCERADGPELYKEVLEADCHYMQGLSSKSSLEEMVIAIEQTDFGRLPGKKQECDEGLKERVKAYRDLAKDIIKAIKGDIVFIKDEKLLSHIPKMGKWMESLVELIKLFEQRYQHIKGEQGIVDYNDLEHFCLQVLIEPVVGEDGKLEGIAYTEAAKELSQFYKEVYIDEYQDSNTVQETILQAIAEGDREKGPTRFMVGDMKQSIYRFRLANPLIFAHKYETWDKYGIEDNKVVDMAIEDKHIAEDNPTTKNICIDLSQNFRSRENILRGVNDLFEQLMSKQVGDLVYDEFAKLKVGNFYLEGNAEQIDQDAISGPIEVHLLETGDKEIGEEEENDLASLKKIEAEAIMVAHLIDKLLKGEANPTHVFDKELGDYRKVEPRDIVILLRATTGKAEIFENALITKGIGAYAEVSSSFFEAIEIQTMISLFKIIDNPLQDIPLITVLRSPIVGVTLDDLVYIRKAKETGCFYEALETYLESDVAEDKIKRFMGQLIRWREQSTELTLEELFSILYVETGYYRYVSMLPTGAKKKANLRMLRKYGEEIQTNSNGKLFSFIQYLDKLKEGSEGLEEAKLVGGNENLVRIMSIHKSKGLEFGVVFLCNTDKKFNNKDIIKNVLIHPELGLAPDYVDVDQHLKYPTIPKLAIKNQILSENISEEMRVFYVALTRAKEKLFITGVVNHFEKSASNWSLYGVRKHKEILSLGVRRAGSYLNWIGIGLYAHPQGSLIGEKAQVLKEYELEGLSDWQLKIWHLRDIQVEDEVNKALQEQKGNLLEEWDSNKTYGEHKEEIHRRLSFEYKHKKAVTLPLKLSVSDIKKEEALAKEGFNEAQIEAEKRVPDFIRVKEEARGARRGTLIHSIFEQLDYLTYRNIEDITKALQQLVVENKIDQEALETVNIPQVVAFANAPLTQRMRMAKKVWKEKQFVYLIEANSVDETYPEEEEILLQGVIDILFVEEDGVVIVDYKTDYVDQQNKMQSIDKIKTRYGVQLALYEKAVGEILKTTVKEKWIYLYSIDEWVQL